MGSRVSTGFHRIGLVLSLPVLVAAAYLGYEEAVTPHGSYVVDLPEGVEAWKPDAGSNAQQRVAQELIAEQTRAGIVAPTNFLITGLPLETLRQDGTDWTSYQLRDGRKIKIASTDKNIVLDTATNFLLMEKLRGSAYTQKDKPEFGGVRVAYLGDFDDIPIDDGPWPKHRVRDWTLTLSLAAAGVGIYLIMRSIGWIIDGFLGSTTKTAK
jgi:hypothetical protein